MPDEHARFTLDLPLEGKAASAATTEDGDLIIEGIAADWLFDRQGEAFEPGAFEAGLKSFIGTNPIVCYHHDYSKALGQVLEADVRPEGLHVKARIDAPAPGSWAEDVYRKIKRGTIRGLSVGGLFKRRLGADGRPRIYKCDFAELSVTPLPMGYQTLATVAGKAFHDEPTDGHAAALGAAEAAVGSLERLFERLGQAIEGKSISAAERKRHASSGAAMADGSFPITHCGRGPKGVGAALADLGRTNKSRSAVMAHIRKRAKALGCSDRYPALRG